MPWQTTKKKKKKTTGQKKNTKYCCNIKCFSMRGTNNCYDIPPLLLYCNANIGSNQVADDRGRQQQWRWRCWQNVDDNGGQPQMKMKKPNEWMKAEKVEVEEEDAEEEEENIKNQNVPKISLN